MTGFTLPSDLELQALSVLYSEGPTTVATVLGAMPDRRERAYTTILSVMQSLERKGLVKAQRDGRAYVYRPIKSQESIVAPLAKDFVQNAFGGSIGSAILLLLSSGVLTPEEKLAVQGELTKHKAMAAKKKTKKKAPAKKAAKRKTAKKAAAKRKPAKKAAKKKAAKRKPAKKAAKRKTAKKATKKKAAKKPAKKKAAKKAAKKKATKKKATTKKATKKATKKKATKKRR